MEQQLKLLIIQRELKNKPAYVTTGGTRYYSQEQLNNFLGLKIKTKINKKIVGYCRVSSTKQKDDLERQIENVRTYMIAKGYQFEIITDIEGCNIQTRKNKIFVKNMEQQLKLLIIQRELKNKS